MALATGKTNIKSKSAIKSANKSAIKSKIKPARPSSNQLSNENAQHLGLQVFRVSSQDELALVVDVVRELHAESRYQHLPFSEKKFANVFTRAISNPDKKLAIYVQYNGTTVGFLTAGIGDYFLSEHGRMATVYGVYVSAKIRNSLLGGKIGIKLIRMMMDWAKSQNAQEVHIHATSGIEAKKTDKLLSRLGFKTYGGNYVGRVG